MGPNRLRVVGGRAPQFFHDFWEVTPFRLRWLATGILAHIVLIHLPVFEWTPSPWRAAASADLQPEPHAQITWYGLPKDLPLIAAYRPKLRPAAPAPKPRRGAEAFHPRQTITVNPPRPNHPRQLLMEPSAPVEAPKFLPALPNIVQWAENRRPAKPRLAVDPRALAKPLPRQRPRDPLNDVGVPQVPDAQITSPDVKIALDEANVVKPKLVVAPPAPTRPAARPTSQNGEAMDAPELGAPPVAGSGSALKNLVALSATPAPPAPEVVVPPGNLSARLAISPAGKQPGEPGGNGNAAAGTNGESHGGEKGISIPGVSITGGDPPKTAQLVAAGAGANGSGNGNGPSGGLAARGPLPSRPVGTPRNFDLRMTPMKSAPLPANPAASAPVHPGPTAPEAVLGPREVYSLHVNMPNLASATGSWVLNFAEMTTGEASSLAPGEVENPADLVGPVPLHKVDPRYPPALVADKVEGEVVLYAIIRRDGSVDSIQVARGVDPQLDENAMRALARWKFKPAERGGKPVELEAVVHIPFRVVRP